MILGMHPQVFQASSALKINLKVNNSNSASAAKKLHFQFLEKIEIKKNILIIELSNHISKEQSTVDLLYLLV